MKAKKTHRNQSLQITASALGIPVGLAGIMHGIFEILQGNVRTQGMMIAAIVPEHRFWEYGWETAFTLVPKPFATTARAWFELLQRSRILGLAYLHVFDLVHYVLGTVVFLALNILLKRSRKSAMEVAILLAILGIAVYLSSHTALSLLSLSEQWPSAQTKAERNQLLGSGEALLALNRFSAPGVHPGSGGYLSLLLVALAGMISSAVMLGTGFFPRTTAYIGLLAGGLDLIYCLAYLVLPGVEGGLLSVMFIPAAGLCWFLWHILVGWRLLRLGASGQKKTKQDEVSIQEGRNGL